MTYLIDNFIKTNAVTAITGRPSMNQSFLADEVAFSVATGVPLFDAFTVPRCGQVVIFVDGLTGERNLLSRYAAWCAGRGVTPEAVLEIVDIEALRKGSHSLNAVFFSELDKRGITAPMLIVSSAAATSPGGFYSPEAQQELSLAQYAIGRTGCAVLLAGHTGPLGRADELNTLVNAAWQVNAAQDRTTLTQGDLVIELTDRTVGGNGLVVTRIYDAV